MFHLSHDVPFNFQILHYFRCLGTDLAVEMFVMTKDGFIMTDDSICLDAPENDTVGPMKVRIMACSGFTRQKWQYDNKVRNKIYSSLKCFVWN